MSQEERKRKALEKKLKDTRAEFLRERDEVLRTLDPQKFMALFIKWRQPPPQTGGPDIQLAVMHRARLALPGFTIAEQTVSAQWLVNHGFALPAALKLRDGVLYGART